MNFLSVTIVFASAVLVAVADAFIKQSAISGNFVMSLKTPWFYGSLLFYFIQILVAVYYFMHHWELGIMGNIFVVFYAILTIALGIMFFHEKLSASQIGGIALGLVGVFLMTK